ncbi:MAG TPA: CbiX/SirB N-terminal domain-containing protein [Burkholderiales bacterium]|nr:CbiX/SirB N-terminal domain-containing protein [Burkholderiales bacterium]
MKPGIVLFAHGSRDSDWAHPFQQLAARLRTKVDGPIVVAYLEFMSPTLYDAIASLGTDDVRVVPVFLGQGGHMKEDLPKLVAAARKKHSGVTIRLEPAIGERPIVIEAIAAAIARN